MRGLRRLQLTLLGLALVIIATVIGSAVREKRAPFIIKVPEAQRPPGDATLEVTGVSFGYTNKNNEKEWELKAAKARYFKDRKRVQLEDIEVILYRPDNQTYKLSGKHGELDIDTQNITVQGAVKGTLPNNVQITTESFLYDNAKRIVTTTDKVFITRERSFMEGTGMVINIKEETIDVLANVKVTENR